MTEKRRIPIQEGLFTVPSEPHGLSYLIGTRCRTCGEVTWYRRPVCLNCQSEEVEEILLNRRGKLWAFTQLHFKSPPPYEAPEPYVPIIVGFVELSEGLRVLSLLTDCNFDKLRIGMDMEMIVEKAYEDSAGNEIVVHKFKPV
jgi:uncharacterized protein